MLTQSICRACMEVEKTASFEEFKQVGKPCPWYGGRAEGVVRDRVLWKSGLIFCPHRRVETTFENALPDCLRRGAQVAAEAGVMVVRDV